MALPLATDVVAVANKRANELGVDVLNSLITMTQYLQDGTIFWRVNADGVLRSRVFPGLHLQPTLFWQGDLAGVLDVLRSGLATPEHAAFVERLRTNNTNL